ncbi:hypothetical protein E2L08_13335 [Palleronia sediminis]|uniref:Aminoglycoside phosphotransferase domain-containing protein n=1 Tax=Palleronia sediminis TaxID=2547833 RepID=A0A4R6A1T3_9RHOB|nr:hypothetical protein [Palleronia sediminis]TDL76572.1 hypothetical protein E2L08_13335 [Palleronia sediminis]
MIQAEAQTAIPPPPPGFGSFTQPDAAAMRADLDALAGQAGRLLGTSVQRIEAPGGPRRASLRLILGDGRRVIATRRPDRAERLREALVLGILDGADGHVPRLLAFGGGVLIQEDCGGARLSDALAATKSIMRETIAADAVASLAAIRRIATATGIAQELPFIGMASDWLADFSLGPVRLAERLGIAAPRYDVPGLAQSLIAGPQVFTKWDARPGNAALSDDDPVMWFDWGMVGRRGGFEDVAALISDEFWPLDAAMSLRIVAEELPDTDSGPLATYAMLHACSRLRKILRQAATGGWETNDRTLRHYDLIGVARPMSAALARRARDYALTDAGTEALGPFFDRVARRVEDEDAD